MGIAHGHYQVLMTKDFLERQNIPASHHEMTGKGVTQHVCHLSCWQLQADTLNSLAKGRGCTAFLQLVWLDAQGIQLGQ